MATFDTPQPITAHIVVPVGDVWLKAGDRADTVVTVRPANPASKADGQAAEQTTVELTGGRLLVRAPKSWRRYSFFSAGPSVDIDVELPAGSHVQVDGEWTSVRTEGRLGDCRFEGGSSVRVAEVGELTARNAAGELAADKVSRASITSKAGGVRIRVATGPVEVKNAAGDCWLGEAVGRVQVNTSSGDIAIDRAAEAVTARTAYGSIRVGHLGGGASLLQTSYGAIEVGVPEGTAIWLDVSSKHGRVHNNLRPTGAPESPERTAELRAYSAYGDVIIRRSV